MPAVHNFHFAKSLILRPLVQFVGQDGSEVTGPAFSPLAAATASA